MGKFDFQVDPEFVRMLERMENYDEIAPKMLNGAVPILERHVKRECLKHRRTEQMINSVKKTKSFKNAKGWSVTVRPTGMSTYYKNAKGENVARKTPVRNMEIMAHLEYGTKNQSPTPVLTKALNDATPEVMDEMQEIFEEEVNGR